MAKDRVGIIGPGRMGLAMLKHLKKAGFEVTVYDISEDQLAKAVEAGGLRANSPREVGENSDYVIVGVGFEPEVYACLTGDEGALADPRRLPGSLLATLTSGVGTWGDRMRILRLVREACSGTTESVQDGLTTGSTAKAARWSKPTSLTPHWMRLSGRIRRGTDWWWTASSAANPKPG